MYMYLWVLFVWGRDGDRDMFVFCWVFFVFPSRFDVVFGGCFLIVCMLLSRNIFASFILSAWKNYFK